MARSSIQVLPEDLINKIAAGEVIERPASVVKELVENAIDAGATKITVDIQGAGQKLIRVSDNGSGMTEEEIKLALERHSTSKIRSLDDLFNIQTLGFRGEALPSIASVSKLKLEPNPSGRGITAEVKELFYNTPVRKKFLKSPNTETGHIGDIIAKSAMARPEIAFELIVDGKQFINSPGTGRLEDAVMAVYGIDLLKGLVEVNDGKVNGLISLPTFSRIDRNYITFFVNGRYVKNFLLNRALEEAYRTLIPGNRYPIGVLFVTVDPKQVDVNVHPAKREVKFVNTQAVMDAVTASAKKALSSFIEARSGVMGKEEVGLDVGSGKWEGQRQGQEDSLLTSHFLTHLPLPTSSHLVPETELEVSAIQPLFPIYQLRETYIIATDGEELVLIDQHAAHERIIYDQLSHKASTIIRQSLLIPETIELSAKESSTLQESLDYLRELGFDLEEFGGSSFILRSVPAVSTKVSAKALIADILSELQELGRSAQLEIKRENIRKTIACKAAVKAGDKLTAQEMSQLIRNLYATENPLTCPHGRPTMVRLAEEEIKRRFLR